jgi:hypothetical protein
MTTQRPFPAPTDPQMSVILVTDRYQTIREVMAHLRDQTVRDRLEIVIVAPAGQPLDLDPGALDCFASVCHVEVDSILPLAQPRAAGVRVARAPVIVIGETHAYPHPGWAEALIKAHAQPWAVVVPAFGNANPEGALSWAAFLRDYGRWVDGLPAGEIDFMPPYNTATKREVLLQFGGRLDHMVSQGDELGTSLRARGYRTYFEPAAKIDHANVARPMDWLVQRFLSGRVLAAGRAERWSRARRAVYTCGAPLIPAVVLSRLVAAVRQMKRSRRLPMGTLLAMVVGAVASAAGEMVTYAAGAGRSVWLRSDEYELHKVRYTYLPVP